MSYGKYRFASGDPLILQQEAALVAWRIDGGEIEIWQDGQLQRQLGEGELLGEEIVLHGTPAPYSAYAKGKVSVTPIDKAQLETIFKPEAAANDAAPEAQPATEPMAFAEGADIQMGGDAVNAFAAMAKAMERQTELMEIQHKAQQTELDIIQKERKVLTSDFLGKMADLGAITPLMHDEEINDILINGHNTVFIERFGKLEKTNITLSGEDEVLRIAHRIARGIGREINPFRPLLDARLADGSRVNIISPPLAVDGTSISIRKFSKRLITLDDMIGQQNLSYAVGEFLKIVGAARMNVLISGGTGSGKTTLLNAVSQHISHGERLVTIEDAAELKLDHPDLVRLETRPAASKAHQDAEVTMRDLVKNALRMRPDRIIVGEVRGEEAFDMMQAMNTGHEGSLTTVHANHPRDALSRIENMVSMADMNIPQSAIRYQIASALQLVVQVSRQRDGHRRITHVTEIIGMEGDTITMNDLFTYVAKGEDENGKITGEFKWAGIMPRCVRRVSYYGLLPRLEEALGVKIPVRGA
jgi:pilus assembly protein CpaF